MDPWQVVVTPQLPSTEIVRAAVEEGPLEVLVADLVAVELDDGTGIGLPALRYQLAAGSPRH